MGNKLLYKGIALILIASTMFPGTIWVECRYGDISTLHMQPTSLIGKLLNTGCIPCSTVDIGIFSVFGITAAFMFIGFVIGAFGIWDVMKYSRGYR